MDTLAAFTKVKVACLRFSSMFTCSFVEMEINWLT